MATPSLEGDDSVSDVYEAIQSGKEHLDSLLDEIHGASIYDRTDIKDNQQFADYKRSKIEGEYGGTRGAANQLYGILGLQPSYQAEMAALTEGSNYTHAGDAKFANDSDQQEARQQLQQLQVQMDAAISGESKTAFRRQWEAIDANLAQTVAAANSIANDKTFYGQVFHSQAEANAYADHLKSDAEKIHDSEFTKLESARYDEMQTGQERLEVLQRSGAGDKEGAAREALESSLNAEGRKIDPNDIEKVKQFEQIYNQSLANFDADAAHKAKLQEAQTDDQIQSFQEEAKEAQLRAAGRTDDARVEGLNFSTQQRVKSLQEAADAETDPVRKAQLQREIAAANSAGKIEQDALQQEIQREHISNTQASALSAVSQLANSNMNALHDAGGASNLADAVKKLDAATTKLDKALSDSKTLVLVKD